MTLTEIGTRRSHTKYESDSRSQTTSEAPARPCSWPLAIDLDSQSHESSVFHDRRR